VTARHRKARPAALATRVALTALAATLLAAALPARSQDGSGPAASAAADGSASRPVVASVSGDPMNRVGDPVFVTVTLRNQASRDQIVKNLSVKVDAMADQRFTSAGECTLTGLGEITLTPGETYSQTCRFPVSASAVAEPDPAASAAAPVAAPSLAHRTGWARSAWYVNLFGADLRLIIDVDVEGTGSRRFFPVVTVKAGEASIFVGGVFGAMLLALFVLAERLLKNPDVRENWVRNVFVTLLMGLRGGLLAVIALLLGKTTQGVGSPVMLTVVDFSGGVLIGLFSYPLASWISSTLKLDGVFVSASPRDGAGGAGGAAAAPDKPAADPPPDRQP